MIEKLARILIYLIEQEIEDFDLYDSLYFRSRRDAQNKVIEAYDKFLIN